MHLSVGHEMCRAVLVSLLMRNRPHFRQTNRLYSTPVYFQSIQWHLWCKSTRCVWYIKCFRFELGFDCNRYMFHEQNVPECDHLWLWPCEMFVSRTNIHVLKVKITSFNGTKYMIEYAKIWTLNLLAWISVIFGGGIPENFFFICVAVLKLYVFFYCEIQCLKRQHYS